MNKPNKPTYEELEIELAEARAYADKLAGERSYAVSEELQPTPETARNIVDIECEDSCCSVYVKLDGKEYVGDLVTIDIANKLERQRDQSRRELAASQQEARRLREALKCVSEELPKWGFRQGDKEWQLKIIADDALSSTPAPVHSDTERLDQGCGVKRNFDIILV